MPDESSSNRLSEMLNKALLPETDPLMHLAEQTNCLAPVVRRFRGEAINLQPILINMVESMLSALYRKPATDFSNSAMADQVARTMWDDPAANQRLQRLWQKLCAEVQ